VNARHLPLVEQRPRTRAECVDGPRPCPWAGCRWHLLLDRSEPQQPGQPHASRLQRLRDAEGPEAEALVERLADEAAGLIWSCALDVADQGARSLEEVAEALGGLTRERARQIETKALRRVKKADQRLRLKLEQALEDDNEAARGGGRNTRDP
jgi:hypothetical protein